MHEARVTLSAVLATVHGWPDIAPSLGSLRAAVSRVHGDIIVADGSGRPPPSSAEVGAETVWLSTPGATIFQLRYEALRAARGEIVVGTEDHCFFPADWCKRILARHREHPEVGVIRGSVLNAATRGVADWASYFVVQAPYLPSTRRSGRTSTAPAANVSYKRPVLDRMHDFGGLGMLDSLWMRELVRDGVSIVRDNTLSVLHDQSMSVGAFSRLHFHVGRTVAAGRARTMDLEESVRAAGAFVIPFARLGRTLALGLRSRYHRNELLRSAPLMLWLLYCQGVGHVLGYGAGAGRSPAQVE